MRSQALAWLQDERAAWARLLDAEPTARPLIVQTLRRWRADPDLADVPGVW
ncbi:MAG TPA: hypothetical protein VG406_09820 [Isosphaeraceae bacterium]|nr:hypothetical protein [Isosphaeraceae bacterium]